MIAQVLPDNAGYVLGAYLVFLALLLVYFVIMAARLSRVERELVELTQTAPPSGTGNAEAERAEAER